MIEMKRSQVKDFFFDSPKIEKKMDAATKKRLSSFGAFVKRRAQTSIRRVGKKQRKAGGAISQPGKPPLSHTDLVRKNIFFVYEEQRKTVIIGPILLNKPNKDALVMLEVGGTTTRVLGGKVKRAVYRARPFMKPAYDEELKKEPDRWAGILK